ncbi:DNA repair protein RecN [hydrothermal vent metagenome]|uniref:DNA repair protein RecN n=1 Tax=hydrothermal vent metagenome TaxID=652676 RepID=A0A3B0UXR3_9ZZZZ
MLKSLFIENYVLIKQLDMDFADGFVAFTGETGAGKSIIVGALSLILGSRADYSVIRDKSKKCDIRAVFDISKNKPAQDWLLEQEIDAGNEIEFRRIITSEGRSKSWLNTRACTNASLKQLGSLLVQIHGQHDQIKLNSGKYQLAIIDQAGQYQDRLHTVASLATQYQQVNQQLRQIELAGALNQSESQLLQYQHQELSQLNLFEHELDELHMQQKSLTGAVNTLANMEQSLALLSGNNSNATNAIAEIITTLSEISAVDLSDILTMLEEVSINLNEVESELQNQHANIEVNPEKLNHIESRLEQIYATARKHNVNAETLYQHQLDLFNQLELNDAQKQQRAELLKTKQEIESNYAEQSILLSQSRQKVAKQFQQQVTEVIQQLGLNKAEFVVQINHNANSAIHSLGQDTCDFQVSMNLGQPPQAMAKTASGGELSRIALAVEICKKQDQSSSFVFDEVDTGIGGAVAETVGKLMRQLSANQQVFAVTHLPQVAGLAHHHYLVSKTEVADMTESSVDLLNNEQRVYELARMSGGSNITETTLKQARAFMLNALD